LSSSIYKTELGDDFVSYNEYHYKKLKTHYRKTAGAPLCNAEKVQNITLKIEEVTCKRCLMGLRARGLLTKTVTSSQ
jgi:transcription elongation factor Elf1